MDIHSAPISGNCLLHDPEIAIPQPTSDTAYLVVTPGQHAQYMNGEKITPIRVLVHKTAIAVATASSAAAQPEAPDSDQAKADANWFNRFHDYVMSFVPTSHTRNADIMRAASFGESDHVSRDSL